MALPAQMTDLGFSNQSRVSLPARSCSPQSRIFRWARKGKTPHSALVSCHFLHLSDPVEPGKNFSHSPVCAVHSCGGGSQASSRGIFNCNPAWIGDPVPLGGKLLCCSREFGGRFPESRILTPNVEFRAGLSGHRILHARFSQILSYSHPG